MSNRLREIREAKGFNQRELAEKTHTSQTTISELELGKRKPWLKVARRLARKLGVPVEELFPDDFEG